MLSESGWDAGDGHALGDYALHGGKEVKALGVGDGEVKDDGGMGGIAGGGDKIVKHGEAFRGG